MNKLGVVQLDLRHTAAARAYFQRAVKLQKKDAVAWNNLGAVEYMDGRFASAISNYNRAIKLNKTSAIYHSNLATAYFEEKKYKDAREQFKIALRLDPDVAHHDGVGGLTAHMISPALERYRKDPRVILIVNNARALRSGRGTVDNAQTKVPPLPPVQPN
jgi:tetratricopeptide (TPR) repeat protein